MSPAADIPPILRLPRKKIMAKNITISKNTAVWLADKSQLFGIHAVEGGGGLCYVALLLAGEQLLVAKQTNDQPSYLPTNQPASNLVTYFTFLYIFRPVHLSSSSSSSTIVCGLQFVSDSKL